MWVSMKWPTAPPTQAKGARTAHAVPKRPLRSKSTPTACSSMGGVEICSKPLMLASRMARLGLVDVAVVTPVGGLPVDGWHANHHVIGGAVGGPEGARHGLVVEGHPVAPVLGEAVGVKGGSAPLQAVQVRNPARELCLLKVPRQGRKVVLIDPIDDFRIADLRHPLSAVLEQVPPVVGLAQVAEAVLQLQIPIVHDIHSPKLGVLMADVAGIMPALGLGVALRGNDGLRIEGGPERMHRRLRRHCAIAFPQGAQQPLVPRSGPLAGAWKDGHCGCQGRTAQRCGKKKSVYGLSQSGSKSASVIDRSGGIPRSEGVPPSIRSRALT